MGEGGGGVLARGKAGLTAQRQRRLVPPGFFLKTRPPSPAPPPSPHPTPPARAHRALMSHVAPLQPLSPSLSSLPLLSLPFLHPLVPPLALLFSLRSSIPSFSYPLLPSQHTHTHTPSPSGPLRTLSSGWRGGGGWLQWWDGEHKSPEMRRPGESGRL